MKPRMMPGPGGEAGEGCGAGSFCPKSPALPYESVDSDSLAVEVYQSLGFVGCGMLRSDGQKWGCVRKIRSEEDDGPGPPDAIHASGFVDC